PPTPVGVLAVPAVAPWMKISEAVDYLRSVAPRTAIPIHYGIIAPEAQGIYFGRLSEMGPAGTEFRVIEPEDSADL
ncbi:MBL fold metallo-hydrolase, partial [Nocardia cyriacigeorgica]